MPTEALTRKLETVAPVYTGLPNRPKSTKPCALPDSMRKNAMAATTKATPSPTTTGLPQPSVLPWVTTTCSASMATMKVTTPGRSKR